MNFMLCKFSYTQKRPPPTTYVPKDTCAQQHACWYLLPNKKHGLLWAGFAGVNGGRCWEPVSPRDAEGQPASGSDEGLHGQDGGPPQLCQEHPAGAVWC